MRILWLIGSLALVSACSSYSVRCNRHLRPINVPDRTASTPGLPGAPSATAATGQP
jgi:hypothetical protein